MVESAKGMAGWYPLPRCNKKQQETLRQPTKVEWAFNINIDHCKSFGMTKNNWQKTSYDKEIQVPQWDNVNVKEFCDSDYRSQLTK